ncbi:hypothetical protein MLD38_011213 [Melastoma candidum]|uniref:Uncharacterized protein n=1 Tax=Melastoma candidum TaxID=119954 RepID=A0ACB9R2E6_9MYRT|nr:hypothetical protein MLD38_011213 [Melastoma candidum]
MVSAGNADKLLGSDSLQGFDCSLDDSLQNELELLLRSQRNQKLLDREAELNIFRSGSAPPTIEGSRRAVEGILGTSAGLRDGSSNLNENINWIFTREDYSRPHPAYSSNYYQGKPSSLISGKDWRVSQRFQAGGSSFDGVRDFMESSLVENQNNSSLFSLPPGSSGLSVQDATDELTQLRQANRLASVEWLGRGLSWLDGLPVSGLGTRTKSFADILQEGIHQPSSLSSLCPRPQSCNAIGDTIEPIIAAPYPVDLPPVLASSDGLHYGADYSGLTSVPSRCISAPITPSFPRNVSIEAKVSGMPCSTGFPLVDEAVSVGGSTFLSSHSSGVDEILDPFSYMNISRYREADKARISPSHLHIALENRQDNRHNLSNLSAPPGFGSSGDLRRKNDYITDLGSPGMRAIGHLEFPKRNLSSNSLFTEFTSSDLEAMEGYKDLAGHRIGGHYTPQGELNSTFGFSRLNRPINEEKLLKIRHELGNDLSYAQHMQRNPSHVTRPQSNRSNLSGMRSHFGSSPDITRLRKAYLEELMAQQKEQEYLHMGKLHAGMDPKHGGSLSFRLRRRYSGATSVGYEGHVPHDERVARISSLMRSPMGDMTSSWASGNSAHAEGRFASSVLDEFKNNKTRSYELTDILGHVVEFSMDQYGSRFIQQKLETAPEEEKKKIFPEILVHARSLMTDVFGNYVIQKFFEHGSESQRKELACQLTGHVLPLSLQMYGCRVIQKALEVVDVEQQIEIVSELDGSIMKCVRDQNGNHVVQKCIECIPQDRVQFIIATFFGQVVPLSMHPYGCRVIQRVLEYCDNPKTQEAVMEEIMLSVYTLAQDQYGNYVIQHVLEHGKPHERYAIITKLSGHFVKMSQQKFASNVVEKCLTFGSLEERQSLIQEMLCSTDENEPLQAMMKDPFGNYVVQKVLEICDDRTLEFILSRIKTHLTTLKRYTYGKHIVSRVEKLITTGERRIGLSASSLSD